MRSWVRAQALVVSTPAAAASTTAASGYKAKQRKAAPSKVEVELDALEAELDRQIDRRTELEDALGQPERYGSKEALEALKTAADAVWCFFVQREVMGLRDRAQIVADYQIPREVMVRLGAR